jgi:signal transduction histidine kinase
VHPLDDKICVYQCSDEHWLMENMLCLLSNAMKYSEKGDVDVHIEVIDDSIDDPSLLATNLNPKRSSLSWTRTSAPKSGAHSPPKTASYSPPKIGAYSLRKSGSFSPPRKFSFPKSGTFSPSRKFSFPKSGTFSPSRISLPKTGSFSPPGQLDSFYGGGQSKKEDGLMIRITVEDHGIGISNKARKSLFAPFKQAQRMAGGTGLGLYSLLKRIEALGGEVKIEIC